MLLLFRFGGFVNRTKFPVGKWLKHGRTTVFLPEKLYGIVPVETLLGGNIQPHPGQGWIQGRGAQGCAPLLALINRGARGCEKSVLL